MSRPTLLLRTLVVVLLLPVAAVTTVRLFGLDRSFPLVAAVTVFPWAVVGGLVGSVLAVVLRWRPAALTACALTLVGLGLLLPRVTPGPYPDTTPGGERITVAVANLRFGRGDATTIVEHVTTHDVDVLVTLELTDDAIAELRMAGLDELMPHTELLPSRLTSGGGIHSALPLTPLPPDDSRGFGRSPRAELTLDDGSTLTLHAAHPLPPIDERMARSWQEGLTGIAAPRSFGPPLVVAGDLNATHDHRLFRTLLAAGWVDAADATGDGLRHTFHGLPWGDPVPPVTLDHVMVDQRVAVLDVHVLPLPDSDHRMLVADLRVPAPGAQE